MNRKELKAQYKARRVEGGVYRILNNASGRFYLHYSANIQATRNWFAGCRKLGTCEHPRIRDDWKKFGGEVFALEVLDLLEKQEEQLPEEFKQDLEMLFKLWAEKLPKDIRY